MQVSVVGRQVEVTDEIRLYTQEKASKLPRFYNRVQNVDVVFQREGDLTSVEMIVSAAGTQDFVAREVGSDARACIDLLIDKIERQLNKYKEKHRNRKHLAKKPEHLEES